MHSLEAEYRELSSAGVLDGATASQWIALENGTQFTLFEELRACFYAAVAAITAGVGLLLKANLEHIGPLTLIAAIALVAAACYASAIRTQRRGEARTLGGDYILLLGALLISADLGYAESQFHWLGSHWSWHLLLLAGLHATTAYALDSRLVLSVALTSLAAWFGIEANINKIFVGESTLTHSGVPALGCAAVIFAGREIHRRVGGSTAFLDVFEHFAVNLGFWGALALIGSTGSRFLGLAILIALAVIAIRKGLLGRQETFVIYGIGYSTLGVCILEAQLIDAPLPAAIAALVTVLTAVALLWQLHRRRDAA